MDTIWIGIAILMNACSACYLFMLFGNDNKSNQHKSDSFILASLCWFISSISFLLPHIKDYFLGTPIRMVALFLLFAFILLVGAYHLFRIIKKHPYMKQLSVKYLSILFTLSITYNLTYSKALSLLLLHVSSITIIFASIFGIIKNIKVNNHNFHTLGASYIVGGIILQLIGLYSPNALGSDIVQILLLCSVPLIMYGFGFMALDNYNNIVKEQLEHISQKTDELNDAYDALYQTSHYDQQTGLKNRQHYDLDVAASQSNDSQSWTGLINFDNFRKINETLGYQHGDDIIKLLSRDMNTALPDNSAIYRMSGGRFAFIKNDCNEVDAIQLTQSLQTKMRTFSITNDLPIELTASIGITDISPVKTLDIIHQELELSMATVSHTTKNDHIVFHQRLLDDFVEQSNFKENLKEATKNDAWSLFFQPQISIATGRICGSEILMRWEREDGHIINPGEFIPIAESIGLMKNIGMSIIEKSFQSIQCLNEKGYSFIHYAINLSGDQFTDNTLIETLCTLKEKHNIPDGQVILEICETVFIEDFETTEKLLTQFHEMGFEIALDDFGTGYSSLKYLAKLPIDEVKFDKIFVENILTDSKARKLLATMIQLTKQLNIRHVIEGVETLEQVKMIEDLGGQCYQGYYFSKPVSFDAIERIMQIMKGQETSI